MCPGLETEQDTGDSPIAEAGGQCHGNAQRGWAASAGGWGLRGRFAGQEG